MVDIPWKMNFPFYCDAHKAWSNQWLAIQPRWPLREIESPPIFGCATWWLLQHWLWCGSARKQRLKRWRKSVLTAFAEAEEAEAVSRSFGWNSTRLSWLSSPISWKNQRHTNYCHKVSTKLVLQKEALLSCIRSYSHRESRSKIGTLT